jgi:hypothetical protein
MLGSGALCDMDETAFFELVARVRRSAAGAAQSLLPADAELRELARRAREFGATDEELALAIGALLAVSKAGTERP